MKKLTCLLLAVLLVLSLAACDTQPAETTGAPETTAPVETTVPATVPTFEEVANPVTYFSLSFGENFDFTRYITAYPDADGQAYVEYVGEVKKVGYLPDNILHGITAALDASGLAALNGQDAWGDGEASGSMYIEFADGSMLTCGFSGPVVEAYATGYNAMDDFFAQLTASLPVYVPQPMILGEVEADLLNEMTAILNGSGIQALDSFTISQVNKDEYFAFTLGLSSDAGIASGAACAPMMMTTAYSLSIVKLEGGADASAVCADFENNLDWMKWVCVSPSDALIATKGNLVLCLLGYEDTYTQTVTGIEAAGWTTVKTLENPNM